MDKRRKFLRDFALLILAGMSVYWVTVFGAYFLCDRLAAVLFPVYVRLDPPSAERVVAICAANLGVLFVGAVSVFLSTRRLTSFLVAAIIAVMVAILCVDPLCRIAATLQMDGTLDRASKQDKHPGVLREVNGLYILAFHEDIFFFRAEAARKLWPGLPEVVTKPPGAMEADKPSKPESIGNPEAVEEEK